jgi:hypothetical protein
MGTVVYAWAAFMALGGTLCFLSVLTKIWIGEYTGLVLLATGHVVWGGVLLGTGQSTSQRYGIALMAWVGGYAFRWWTIREKARRGARVARERRTHE